MSSPCAADWSLLIKIGRYLLRSPCVAITFPWQKRQTHADGYTVSDWAGCPESRKSTSCGFIMVGRHLFKSWSRQQRAITLSSAEAETYGMVACSAELLGIQSCASDLGIQFSAAVYSDASAALGIVQRRGIGKV